MTASPNRAYVPEIDQLRACAALLVFVYHCFQLFGAQLSYGVEFDPAHHWIRSLNPIVAIIEEGHSGVGLFIVLSGFVLSLGVLGHRIDYGRFVLARVARIYPVLIVLAVMAYCVVPEAGPGALITTVLPLNAADPRFREYVSMFWAVSVEFQCYLVFPFLILFSARGGIRYLVGVITLALAFRLLAVYAEAADARNLSYFTIAGRLDQFCIGMIAARLYALHGWRRLPALAFAPAAACAVLMLWAFNQVGGWPVTAAWKAIWPTLEGAVWACFILTYLVAGRGLPTLLSKPVARFGEISYSFYLLHFVVIRLVMARGLYLHLTGLGYYDALITAALVAWPITLAASALLYVVVERPFLQLRPKYVLP